MHHILWDAYLVFWQANPGMKTSPRRNLILTCFFIRKKFPLVLSGICLIKMWGRRIKSWKSPENLGFAAQSWCLFLGIKCKLLRRGYLPKATLQDSTCSSTWWPWDGPCISFGWWFVLSVQVWGRKCHHWQGAGFSCPWWVPELRLQPPNADSRAVSKDWVVQCVCASSSLLGLVQRGRTVECLHRSWCIWNSNWKNLKQ